MTSKYFNVVKREELHLVNLGSLPADRIGSNPERRIVCKYAGKARTFRSSKVGCCFVINATYVRDPLSDSLTDFLRIRKTIFEHSGHIPCRITTESKLQ